MDHPSIAAALLLRARDPGQLLPSLPEANRPRDEAAAYAIQRLVAAQLGPIGGWKVGASDPQAAPTCAPMPTAGICASPSVVPANAVDAAIEAEIAFRLGCDLPPRATPYGRDEVIAALATAHPAIEWLQSRFVDPMAVDRFSQLADSQTHGGFVWGQGVVQWQAIRFETETVTLDVDGASLRRMANPAGDMIRLIQWLADEGAVWAGGLRAGQFVTCGSWTGKTQVRPGQAVQVRFASFEPVRLT